MADLELLNSRDHGRLRAVKRLSTPHFVQIVPAEFAAAAASRPVVLTKDQATGRFYAGAMNGFRPGENFAIEPGAIDRFEPLDLARQGFFVSQNGIAINSHHPRFGDEGEAMFDDDGQPARLLQHIQSLLRCLPTS